MGEKLSLFKASTSVADPDPDPFIIKRKWCENGKKYLVSYFL
jgi:hypothetical protein